MKNLKMRVALDETEFMEIPLNIINKVEDVFDRWIIKGIEELSKTEGVSLTFVLISCAIDYLTSFNVGKETKPEDYGNFLKEYKWFAKKYNPDDIYRSLRYGLVHNFTIKKGKYALTHRNPKLHLKDTKEGQKILNFENFFSDFKRIKEEYFYQVKNSKGDKTRLFLKRFKNLGFLSPVPLVIRK